MSSRIIILSAAGGTVAATWLMIQNLQNGYYTYQTIPHILPLPNGNTAVLTSYQIRASGSYDSPCLTVVDSAGAIKTPGEAFAGAYGLGSYFSMYNSGADNNIYYYYTSTGTQQQYAIYNGSTYAYSDTNVYYGDNGNTYGMYSPRPKTGYSTVGIQGTTYVVRVNTANLYLEDMGYSTGTWRNLSYRSQVDVDSSNNVAYVTASTSTGDIIYARTTASSYTGYSFTAASSTLSVGTYCLAVRPDNTAFIVAPASTSETRLHVINSSNTMTYRTSFAYTAGTATPYFVAMDPDSSTDAYILFSILSTTTQFAIVKCNVTTGVIAWQKVFTMATAIDITSFMLSVYGGYLHLAGKTNNASGSISPFAIYAKFNKTSITNGTYQTVGRSTTYGNVTIGTWGLTLTPSVLSTLALTSNSFTKSNLGTLTMSTTSSGLVPFFYNGVSTGV